MIVPFFSTGGRSLCFPEVSWCFPSLVFSSFGGWWWWGVCIPPSLLFLPSLIILFRGRKPGWQVLPHQTAGSFGVPRRKPGCCSLVIWSEPQQGRVFTFILMLDDHFHPFCSSHFSFLTQLMRPTVCSESGKASDSQRASSLGNMEQHKHRILCKFLAGAGLSLIPKMWGHEEAV